MGTPPASRARPRELGVIVGRLPCGPADAITDVPGVKVGHVTVWEDEPVLRTGVTAVVPDALDALFARPLSAGTAVLNGAGELTGSLQLREWGLLETPVLLTSTMAVGRAFDGAVDAMLAACPEVGADDVVIPVVGECDDSWLSDARAGGATAAHARQAIEVATGGEVAGGAVGAGAGMVCFGGKGGIGTASRLCPDLDVTVGVLVLANFGELERLTVDGAAAGRALARSGFEPAARGPAGSCIVVVATDAPLGARQCERVARRAGLGLARVGSTAHHGSGEIAVAFSTTSRLDRNDRRPRVEAVSIADHVIDEVFEATVDATEEAVLDALFRAGTTTGRGGRVAPAVPLEPVLGLLAARERGGLPRRNGPESRGERGRR